MDIHVVKQGDTIYSIATNHGVSPEQLITDNALSNPNSLVIGQTIVILYPAQTHVIASGETLYSIAEQYNISVITLLQNNPGIIGRDYVYPGETLVIRYSGDKLGTATVNGYAYPYIDRAVLIKTLPYLTYLTPFTYGFTPEGELVTIDDDELIQLARDYGVAPLMLLSTYTSSGGFSNELASDIFYNAPARQNLIENVVANIRNKNYYGLEIDFEYILPTDRQAFVNFVEEITTILNANGYEVTVALAPKTSSAQKGLLYEAHDYAAIGQAANGVLLMTYEWGYTYGSPMAVSPINKVKEVLDYAVTQIQPEIIKMGIPNYGYDWTLPFIQGESKARSLGNVEAVEQAEKYGAQIQYDELAQSPYYSYYDENKREHIVWFEDARSIDAKARLISQYGFNGMSYWTIMKYFPQNWLVVNSLYTIEKV